MLGIFDIAGSGMSAQSLRLNVTASNIANAESVSSSEGETYRARQPVFETLVQNQVGQMLDEVGQGQGVKVAGIVESDAPLIERYEPENPMANEDGYVFYPNVNIVEEMANMISASRSFQTNVEIFNTSKQLMQQVLRLGQ